MQDMFTRCFFTIGHVCIKCDNITDFDNYLGIHNQLTHETTEIFMSNNIFKKY